MKKILFLSLLALTLVSSGCIKKTVDPITGVKETGTVIEAVNGQSYQAKPGDVVHVKLTGQAKSGKQWSVASSTTIDLVMLKDHQVTGLEETASAEEELVDQWWIKVEKTGEITLSFNYGSPGSEILDSFSVKIISQ